MNLKRTKNICIGCFAIFLILCLRLIYIGCIQGNEFKKMAAMQQKKSVKVKSVRGDICDRRGIPLTDRETATEAILPDGSVGDNFNGAVFSFDIKERFSPLASHITGYTSPDGNGLCGIEKLCNPLLSDSGSVTLSYNADASGTPKDGFSLETDLKDGQKSVYLTLDYHIQKIAEEVMDKYIKKGAVVILDTKSFDVLAMASRPAFDGNNIKKYESSKDGELLNRALLGYNAGSVFKIVTAAAALDSGIDYRERYFDCKGVFYIGGEHTFGCHNTEGHGILSLDEGFAHSCNCCFYVTGLEVGAKKILSAAQSLGMGNAVLTEPLGESGGNIPLKNDYTPYETLNLAIGQGEILITPLQCALMTAIIANGGVKKDVNIMCTSPIECEERVISKDAADKIAQMMRSCVLVGTGNEAAASPVSIAGKTGSAESGWIENGEALVHGWFCGFFPYDNPRYAMAILAEGGKSGAKSCVEPFCRIAEKINEIYPFKQ